MDKAYFDDCLERLENLCEAEKNTYADSISILRQIAADAREEQAGKDREVVSKKLDKLAEQMEYGDLLKDGEIYRNELIQKYDQKTLTVAEGVILAALDRAKGE